MIDVPTLSIGDVPVLVRPVADQAALAGLVDVIRGIHGVDGVRVEGHRGLEARLTVHVDRPVSLAGELRTTLYHSLESCTFVAGRLVVILNTSAAPPMATPPGGATPTADDDPRWATTQPAAAPHPDAIGPADPAPATDRGPVFGDPGAAAAAARSMDRVVDLSIMTFDLEQRFLTSTGGIPERLGLDFTQMRGHPAVETIGPKLWALVERGFADALRGATSTIDYPSPDGEHVYEATFSPLIDGTSIIGGMVITRDVTEARRGARLLAELTAVLQVTFDRSPIGQALLSPTGRWLRVNETLQRLLGFDEAGLVTRRVQDLTHPDDLPRESALLRELVDGRRASYALSKRFLRADGHEVAVVVVTTALLGTDGALQAVIAQVTPAAG